MKTSRSILAMLFLVACLVGACVSRGPGSGSLHRWWAGRGPVLPHDGFPGDCKLCHVGEKWDKLRDDFQYDHKKETGVALEGAHEQARCLRCHNDRGPVSVFTARGCAGCHEDVHTGELGANCTLCHQQRTWDPVGQVERHNRTRFPLTGAHMVVSCHRCHPGARVGNFLPADTECLSCHAADLAATTNPPHIPLGYVDHCEKCHLPTQWNQATVR